MLICYQLTIWRYTWIYNQLFWPRAVAPAFIPLPLSCGETTTTPQFHRPDNIPGRCRHAHCDGHRAVASAMHGGRVIEATSVHRITVNITVFNNIGSVHIFHRQTTPCDEFFQWFANSLLKFWAYLYITSLFTLASSCKRHQFFECLFKSCMSVIITK